MNTAERKWSLSGIKPDNWVSWLFHTRHEILSKCKGVIRIWCILTLLDANCTCLSYLDFWDKKPASYKKGEWEEESRQQTSHIYFHFSSVNQSCLTLCDPMNHSTPGLPVYHQLLEFTQTHMHRVSDIIQRSHPLSSPSSPASNPSQHQSLF